jgi:hypothetical protein
LFAGWFLLTGALTGQPRKSSHPTQLASRNADPGSPLQLTRTETGLHESASTLIDWTPQQIHDFPLLHTLQAVGSQDQLPIILDRAGQTGAVEYQEFPRISCDELVTSEIGSPPKAKHKKLRYIVFPRRAGDVDLLEEYRTDPERNLPEKLNFGDLFMITSGFASAWTFISPDQQHDSQFRYFGTQWIQYRECHVVGFAQDPRNARNFGELQIEGKRAPMYLQGLGWIDSRTFQILRVVIWLLAPRLDIHLNSMTATVDFSAVQPRGSERILWLPRDVNVRVHYRDIVVCNTHHYSNFRLFRVESAIKP